MAKKKVKPRGRNGGRKPLFDEPSSPRLVTLPDRLWELLDGGEEGVSAELARRLDEKRVRHNKARR